MQEKISTFFDLVTYALAAVSGGLGGCASAAYLQSRVSSAVVRWSFVVAYMIVGMAMGVLVGALSFTLTDSPAVHDIILRSVLAGILSPVILSVLHSYTRWQLKKQGKRYTIVIEPLGDDES